MIKINNFIYNLKRIIYDLFPYFGITDRIFIFSPQYQKLIEFGPYKDTIYVGLNIGQELSLYNFNNYIHTKSTEFNQTIMPQTQIVNLNIA